MTKNEIEKVEPNPVDRVINAIKKIERCGYFIIVNPDFRSATGYEFSISLSDLHHQLGEHKVEGRATNVDTLGQFLEKLANEYSSSRKGRLRKWIGRWRKEK